MTPLTRAAILEAVADTEHLPPLPRVVADVERELMMPDPSAAAVARSIERDPALAATILRLANSALYLRRSPVSAVGQAVTRLGLTETRRVVLAAALMGLWRKVPGVDLERFWSHSIAVAFVSSLLLPHVKQGISNEAAQTVFTAGLLHDIGALILAQRFPEETIFLYERGYAEGRAFAELELEAWDIDHAEVAAVLAATWNLPAMLRDAMSFHHRPARAAAENRTLVQLVHFADFYCTSHGIGRHVDESPGTLDADAERALALDPDGDLGDLRDKSEQSRTWVNLLRATH